MSLWTFPLVFGMHDQVGMWQLPSHSSDSASLQHRWAQPLRGARLSHNRNVPRSMEDGLTCHGHSPRLLAWWRGPA